jgi:hypothetical protein
MSNRSQELAGAGFRRRRIQHFTHRLEAYRHVVAVIAIAEDGVQSRQIVAVAIDRRPAAGEVCTNIRGGDVAADQLFLRPDWQSSASVATLSSSSNRVISVSCGMLMIPCWLLDESGFTMGTTSGRKGGTNW